MGRSVSIRKFLSKFFKGSVSSEENLTRHQIDEMERHGYDVSEHHRIYEERAMSKEDSERQLLENSLAMLDYGKLSDYKRVNRSLESGFVQDVLVLAKMSTKEQEEILTAPIIYGCVVDPPSALCHPGNLERVRVVLVFALDTVYMYNDNWLRETANRISSLKESVIVPDDCRKFIRTLRDTNSTFCVKLSENICGDANAWCATYILPKQSYLPGNYIPASGIIPFLLRKQPREDKVALLDIIPSKYYTK